MRRRQEVRESTHGQGKSTAFKNFEVLTSWTGELLNVRIVEMLWIATSSCRIWELAKLVDTARDAVSGLLQLPTIRKKLIYLDQSFLSNICLTTEGSIDHKITTNLFSKLSTLTSTHKIYLVISDIHSSETTGINVQHADKRKKLWQFQNHLAHGEIAGDWEDVFIAQHRRMLSDDSSDQYPDADIGLRNPHAIRIGTHVVSTNIWRQKLQLQFTPPRSEIEEAFRSVFDRQVQSMPPCESEYDFLNYIRGLWCKEILQGIETSQQYSDVYLMFEKFKEHLDATQLASALKLPLKSDVPFCRIVENVVSGLDQNIMLQRWSELLKNDSIGSCPSIRIRTAFEAVLLETWSLGHRRTPNKFSASFGVSRQNDINHISTFTPYVDALTTDKDMHNLCQRKVVEDELKQFRCKIFSKKNYDDFEKWLDELLSEPNLHGDNK